MRILLIVEAFRCIGGIEEVVDHLAVEFSKKGHCVAVLSTPYVPVGCERSPDAAVECMYREIPGRKPVSLRHLERLFRRPPGIDALAETIRTWKPDVVSSHEWEWDKFPTIADACQIAGVPFVQSLYDWRGRGKLGESALCSLDKATAITALSHATRHYFEPLIPRARNARVITGGVDWSAIQQAAPYVRDRPYVFTAARLDLRSKALDALVAAFGIVAGLMSEVDLLIAGDGPDRELLENLVASSGLSGRVEFAGVASKEDLWSFYKGARVFMLPSRAPEGLGLVFLEAMASGIPVLGSKSGGTPEIILDGESGFLLEKNHPDEIAGLLSKLLNDQQLSARLGARGRELTRIKYGWDKMASSYLEVLSSCIEG